MQRNRLKKPIPDQKTIENRLFVLAVVLVFIIAAILMFSPVVQSNDFSDVRWQHWVGFAIWFACLGALKIFTNRLIPKHDPYLLPIAALLSGWGLMMIFRLSNGFGFRQMIWLPVGGLLFFLLLKTENILTLLRRYKYIWLIGGAVLTALTLVFGINPSGWGPRLWLGVLGVFFQPSEPLKLLLIAYLAAYFTDKISIRFRFSELILPTLVMLGLIITLLLVQRDLGTAVIFVFLYITMLYAASGKHIIIVGIPMLLALAGAIGYFFSDIVKLRLDTWLNPWADPNGASYQVIQSMIATATGGFLGTGIGMGNPGVVPVTHSDFIFTAITEEFGWLGAVGLIFLFILFVTQIFRLSVNTQQTYQRFLAIGLASYFSIQTIMIAGGNLGLLPLTGVTLPFISYGGSSLVTSFLCLALLMRISSVPKTESPPMHTSPTLQSVLIHRAFSIGFVAVILMSSLWAIWRKDELTARIENPRWIMDDAQVARGLIFDRKGDLIVDIEGARGSYLPVLQHIPLSPVIGYVSAQYGQTGLQKGLYPYLRGLEGRSSYEILRQRLLYNLPPAGFDVRLSLDLNLQQEVDTLLQDAMGALVILNANSGEILAMASHPYFDPLQVDSDWKTLVLDETAPLVNRATQGGYPLSTAFEPFLLADLIERKMPPNFEAIQSDPRRCFVPTAETSSVDQLGLGCEALFSAIINQQTSQDLGNFFTASGIINQPEIILPTLRGQQVLSDTVDLSLFSGDHAYRITPLQMATLAAAISNEGNIPAVRIVNTYHIATDVWLAFPSSREQLPLFSKATSDAIATYYADDALPFWYAVGTAITEKNEVIEWFIGGTLPDRQGTPVVIALVLEAPETLDVVEAGLEMLRTAAK